MFKKEFPNLDLSNLSTWGKLIALISFLPIAYKAISDKNIRPRYTYHLLGSDNSLIGISFGEICYPSNAEDISAVCRIAVEFEDRRFFRHRGIDVLSILKAIFSNLRAGRVVRGASTITQQLARNTLLTPDRSFIRKLAEIILALKLEKHYSKEEILQLYSQHVYLGNQLRGFSAASKIIYRKPIRELDKTSICGLVGLLRKPSICNPLTGMDNYLHRQNFIVKVHRSREKNNDHVKDILPDVQKPNPILINGLQKERWTNFVEHQVGGDVDGYKSMLSPITRIGFTIDRMHQTILDNVLREVSACSDIKYASGVILDNSTADILAESSWRDGQEWNFSPTFFGNIQPGSTYKTFAYLAALESGFDPAFQLDSDIFESSYIRNNDGNFWKVRNYREIYRGGISLLDAFRYSDNTAFARLAECIDHELLDSIYSKFNLCERGQATPAIVLGGISSGVTLLKLVAAYSAIARNGVYKSPRVIKYIQRYDGSVEHLLSCSTERLLISDYELTRKLKSALRHSALSLSIYNFSGKTGTTKAGSLFVGYNDRVSLAIWLGPRSIRNEFSIKGISAIKVAERWLQKAMLGYKHDIFSI